MQHNNTPFPTTPPTPPPLSLSQQNASSRSSQYSPGARRAPATPRSPQPRFPPRDPVEAHLYDCYHPSPHGGRRAQSPAASYAAVPSSPVIVERQLSQGLRDYRVRRGSQKGGCVAYELRHMQDAEWAASQHLQDQRVRVLEAPAKKSRRFDAHDTHVFSQTKSVTAKKRDKHNAAPSPRESGFFAGGRIQYDDSTYYHSETSLPASPLSRSSGTTRARSPGASRRPSSPAPRRRTTPATPVTHSPFARSGGGGGDAAGAAAAPADGAASYSGVSYSLTPPPPPPPAPPQRQERPPASPLGALGAIDSEVSVVVEPEPEPEPVSVVPPPPPPRGRAGAQAQAPPPLEQPKRSASPLEGGFQSSTFLNTTSSSSPPPPQEKNEYGTPLAFKGSRLRLSDVLAELGIEDESAPPPPPPPAAAAPPPPPPPPPQNDPGTPGLESAPQESPELSCGRQPSVCFSEYSGEDVVDPLLKLRTQRTRM